jgi:hypothetical protein
MRKICVAAMAALLSDELVAAVNMSKYAASPPPRTWEKVLLTEAAKTGAVCLDGGPGGYYISEGAQADKWVIFHQGGGWCSSDASCAQRALGNLGSSKGWGPTYTDTYEGSMLFETPPFDQYTVVYAMYCDGGSWTGDAPPVTVKPDPSRPPMKVWYRGRRLLDAMIDDLLARGLSHATQLLYGGCSAGGLTSYLHADYVASRVPSTTNTLAIADAMFAVESNSYTGVPLFPTRMEWGFAAWNASASVNQRCRSANPGANGAKCMFGSIAAGWVQTPMFVLNSKYDTWQEKAIIGANASMAKLNASSAAAKFWTSYGHKVSINALVLAYF